MSTAPHAVFYEELSRRIDDLGGMFNAHLHLDRVGTIDTRYWSHTGIDTSAISCIPLLVKHGMIKALHEGPAYQSEDLKWRVNSCLDSMIQVNTARADTFVDVTPDNVGLSAIQTLHEIKLSRRSEIDLRLGAYSPMGYVDAEPHRWDLLEGAMPYADFIGSLPEADDQSVYPERIGYSENCRRMLELAVKHKCEVHFHVDQRNEPSESGTEQLVEAVKNAGCPCMDDGSPMVWAVHVISPSTYEEPRFESLVSDLAYCNIGVISSPSAALGMRQLRGIRTPTYNSIARLLEFLAAGIPVRIGSDNIADICSPSTTSNLMDEILVLTAALRYYHIDTLAKVAAGVVLTEAERESIRGHLARNELEIRKTMEMLSL